MINIAISYIRFSTKKQAQGDSLNRQLSGTRAYALAHDLDLDESITYQDLGVSAWKGKNRTEGMLRALLDAIKTGSIKPGTALLVERLDRLSREGVTKGIDLMMQILRAGVDVHSTTSGRVFTFPKDSTAEFMLAMEIGIEFFQAAFENEKRSERVGKVWVTKKTNSVDGKAITGMCPFWLKAELGKPIVVIPERVAIVQKILTLAENGYGARRIINQLVADGDKPFTREGDARRGRIWTLPYVQRLLRSRSVLGEFQPHKKIDGVRVKAGDPIANYYPQIISQSQFDAVQLQISKKNRMPADKVNRFGGGNRGGGRYGLELKNLFSGICYNAASGLVMTYNAKSPKSYANLVSVWRQGIPQSRIRYATFERAFLGFLEDLDWRSVAGQTESEVLKCRRAELERITSELDKTSRLIARRTEQMQDSELSDAIAKVFATQIAHNQAHQGELASEQDRLQQFIAHESAKCEALHCPESLRELLQDPEEVVLRRRMQSEIRKRIERIDLSFSKGGCQAFVHFINGACRLIDFRKDGAVLAWQRSWERGQLSDIKAPTLSSQAH